MTKKLLGALLMACTLVACDDDTALVGTDIMPDGDKMTAMA